MKKDGLIFKPSFLCEQTPFPRYTLRAKARKFESAHWELP